LLLLLLLVAMPKEEQPVEAIASDATRPHEDTEDPLSSPDPIDDAFASSPAIEDEDTAPVGNAASPQSSSWALLGMQAAAIVDERAIVIKKKRSVGSASEAKGSEAVATRSKRRRLSLVKGARAVGRCDGAVGRGDVACCQGV
jgi:hypothetical protein